MNEIEKAIKSARAAQAGRIFGSFEDKEEVDKQSLSKGEEDEIEGNPLEKSDIMDSLNYNSEIKVSKTGKEIKEQVDNVIMPELTSNLAVAKNEADEKLKDCGLAPTRNVENYWTDNIKIDCGYKMYCWDETRISKNDGNIVNSLSAEDAASKKGNYPENEAQSLAREQYNEAIRKICNILVDIKACEVLKTLKDETKFELSPRQVITFKF